MKIVNLVKIQVLVMFVSKDTLTKSKMVKTFVLKWVLVDRATSSLRMVRKQDVHQDVPHVLKVKCLVNNVLKGTFLMEKNV